MNKEEMQKRLEAIESEAKTIREALGKKKKWEPKGGDWLVGLRGVACKEEGEQRPEWAGFGVLYPTKQQAEKAAKAFRKYHRLYAYVAEHAPDWEADWDDEGQVKCTVDYSYAYNKWTWSNWNTLQSMTVYMPVHVAEELVRKLNSGEVEL